MTPVFGPTEKEFRGAAVPRLFKIQHLRDTGAGVGFGHARVAGNRPLMTDAVDKVIGRTDLVAARLTEVVLAFIRTLRDVTGTDLHATDAVASSGGGQTRRRASVLRF